MILKHHNLVYFIPGLPIHDHQLESLTKQIATLEMKELNEKQRADHADNKCKLLQVNQFWNFMERQIHFCMINLEPDHKKLQI